MLDSEVKVIEKSSSSSIPESTEQSKVEVPTDLPTDTVLRILFTMSKKLEKEALAQVLTGTTPKGETVTYIRMVGVKLDDANGFSVEEKSVGNS